MPFLNAALTPLTLSVTTRNGSSGLIAGLGKSSGLTVTLWSVMAQVYSGSKNCPVAERVLVGAGVGAGVVIGVTFYLPSATYRLNQSSNMQSTGRVMFTTARAAVAEVASQPRS
jgi:hypothetical protein